MPALCGRDPALLDAGGMARAGTESMAENTSDAVVAPLLWGAVAGVPGLLGYRAVNTLDAMVGYRSARYLRFGWAAARLDDLVNLCRPGWPRCCSPALAPVVGGSPPRRCGPGAATRPRTRARTRARSRRRRRGARGALGGRTEYAHGVEERPRLGSGPPPRPADLRRAAGCPGWCGGGADRGRVCGRGRPSASRVRMVSSRPPGRTTR